MLSMILQSLRHHLGRLVGVWVTLVCATVLVGSSLLLCLGALRPVGDATRFTTADAVVAGRTQIRPDKGDFSTWVRLPETASVPDSLLRQLAERSEVASAVGVRGVERAVVAGDRHAPVLVTDWPSVAFSGWHPTPGHGDDTVALTRPLADALGVVPGQQVALVGGGSSITVCVVQVLGDANSAAQAVVSADLLTRLGVGEKTWSAVALDLHDGLPPEVVATGELADVVHRSSSALTVHTGPATAELERRELAAGRGVLLAIGGSFGGFAVLVSVFMVGVLMTLAVDARRRELAVCRALGASPGMVVRMVAGEGLLLGLTACLVGLPVVPWAARAMGAFLTGLGVLPVGAGPVTAGPWLLVAAAATLLLVAGTAAAGCAWAVQGIALADPVEALRASRAPERGPGRWRLPAGGLLLALGTAAAMLPLVLHTEAGAAGSGSSALMMVIGVAVLAPVVLPRLVRALLAPGNRLASVWLAGQNLTQSPARLAGVVAPLVMTVGFPLAMVCNQAILVEAGARQAVAAVTAPASITATAPGGIGDESLTALRALPEVSEAVTVRQTMLRSTLRVFDEAEFVGLSTLGVGGPVDRAIDPDVQRGKLSQLTGQAIALEDSQARVLGLEPGDQGEFVLGDGATVRLRLAFTYSRGLGLGQAIVPDEALDGHATAPSRVLLLPAEGVEDAQLQTALASFVEQRPGLALAGAGQLAEQARAESAGAAWVNLAGLAVIVVFLVIGVANAMVLATRTRTGELALLRLVGVDRRVIWRVLGVEVLVTTLLAVCLGVLVAAVPLASMAVGFLGAPVLVGPGWLLPSLALVVLAVVGLAVMVPAGLALRRPACEGAGVRD